MLSAVLSLTMHPKYCRSAMQFHYFSVTNLYSIIFRVVNLNSKTFEKDVHVF